MQNSTTLSCYFHNCSKEEADEDFLVSTPDTYNVGDIVGLKIAKENIALRLKGDIQDYAL